MTGDPPPTGGLPAVRPPKPPYIEAFECFTQGREDQIEAFVAYGLFIGSDYAWGSKRPSWPTEEATRESFQRLLYDHEVQKTHDAAKKIVDEHREKLVRDHEKKYLEGFFPSRRHQFLWGVAEATTGAFVWMVILLVFFEGLRLFGIDLLHGLVNSPH
jgi:hypothetical protein